jgi:foldase protein PrsA
MSNPHPAAPTNNQHALKVTSNLDYAAIVNDEKITLSEFNTSLKMAKKNLLNDSNIDFETEEGKFILATTQRSILDDMIYQKLINQEAAKMSITVSQDEITQEIKKLRQGFPSEKEFKETLAEENIDEHDLKKGIKERLVVDKIKKTLTSKIKLSDKEVDTFLKKNQELFSHPKRMQLKQITTASKSEAQEILKKLAAGDDFSDLANAYSIDMLSRTNGGNIGFVESGTMPEDIEKTLFALQEGEISNILETDEGYSIFKCVQIINPEGIDEETSEEEARFYILSKKENEIFQQWFEKIKNKSKIKINPYLI